MFLKINTTLLILLLPLTTLPLTSAWSFELVESRSTKQHINPPQTVLTGIKPCRTLSLNLPTEDYLQGIRITQPTLTTTAPPTPLSEMTVGYIGFWGNEACRGLPRIIIHFYNDRGTKQWFMEDPVREALLKVGFEGAYDEIVDGWSWGQVLFGDEVFDGSIPPGAVAMQRHAWEGADGVINGGFGIVENAIKVRDFIPGREDVDDGGFGVGGDWEGFGEGQVVGNMVLGMKWSLLTPTLEDLLDVKNGREVPRGRIDRKGNSVRMIPQKEKPKPKDVVLPPAEEEPPVRNTEEAFKKDWSDTVDEANRRVREALAQQEAIVQQQAMYRAAQEQAQRQQMAWAYIQQRAAMEQMQMQMQQNQMGNYNTNYQQAYQFAQQPSYNQNQQLQQPVDTAPVIREDMEANLNALVAYWETAGLPYELLIGMLSKLDANVLDQLLGDNEHHWEIGNIATALWTLYMRQMAAFESIDPRISLITPQRYGQLLMKNFLDSLEGENDQSPQIALLLGLIRAHGAYERFTGAWDTQGQGPSMMPSYFQGQDGGGIKEENIEEEGGMEFEIPPLDPQYQYQYQQQQQQDVAGQNEEPEEEWISTAIEEEEPRQE
ncbi:hypothetical protein AA313_de0202845 [Arthrobotrys entomopaga]|nr:hypothetical protein AA313_de0202845 [Arthrobotrys entomopaga]